MSMEMVVTDAEGELVNLLSVVEKDPDGWVSVHVDLAQVSEKMLNKESLSKEILEKINRKSMQVAYMLFKSKLKVFDGKIFVFEDNDVLALFKKNHQQWKESMEVLRQEFANSQFDSILSISDMKEKLGNLICLSEAKQKSAKIYRWKRRAVEAAENIFMWAGPDKELTQEIQKRRAANKQGSILIIEDDVVARGMITLGLRDISCCISQAKDAKSGIINYINDAPDMVLLDIHLPDHSGIDTLTRIKLLDPDAYVVMLSGDSVERNILLTKAGGAAGFVRKPFPKEKLLHYVKQCPTCQRAPSAAVKSPAQSGA